MSVTESKTKTERKSSRKPAKTQETVLSALLEQTEEVSVSLASLIKSPLNVRTVPYSAESVSGPLRALACCRIWLFMPCLVTATVSPQVVADWQHSTCWQSVTSFRLTGLSA